MNLLNTISVLLTTTHNSGARAWVTYQDDIVLLNHQFTNPAKVDNQQAQYYACLLYVKVIRLVIGTKWHPSELHLQTDQLHGLRELEVFSHTRVQFNLDYS